MNISSFLNQSDEKRKSRYNPDFLSSILNLFPDENQDENYKSPLKKFDMFNQQEEEMPEEEENPDAEYFSRALRQQNPNLQQEDPFSASRFGEGKSYYQAIRDRESRGSGGYKAQNSLGYTGAYQFGAQALEDVGLLKKGASKLGNKALKDPSNWTIAGGQDTFLNSPGLQDRAMRTYTAQNENRLRRLGVINKDTPREVINGYLAASHIAGPGGAQNLAKGKDSKDAYGTRTSEYYNLGKRTR